MDTIFINTDGGSRGNPGAAAIGVVFENEKGEKFYKYKECIGIGTNNEAEYKAILRALQLLLKSNWFAENNLEHKKVICRLDSKLVVEQICGRWKIKEDRLRLFVTEIRGMIDQMHLNISFIHIPREENKAADALVNEALDEDVIKNKTNEKG
ncbi:MAG: ribonuclease HI family protein [bacterium]